MTKKIDLKQQDTEQAIVGQKKGQPVIISFSDLYKMKQKGLEKLIDEHGCVYLIGQGLRPLKVEMAGMY